MTTVLWSSTRCVCLRYVWRADFITFYSVHFSLAGGGAWVTAGPARPTATRMVYGCISHAHAEDAVRPASFTARYHRRGRSMCIRQHSDGECWRRMRNDALNTR